jgi:hypothetical protein
MALTLVEASKYSNDILQVGVIEKLVYQDPILEKLQFKDIKGNGLTYNVEATMSGAGFYAVGDVWVESTSVIEQLTAVTTILGGDADVDNFLKATRSDLQDLMGEQINAKIKAIKRQFMLMFYYGWNGATPVDTKGFTGLHGLIKETSVRYPNTVTDGATGNPGSTFSMSQLEKAVDYIKSGKGGLIIMSKNMRRLINKYLRGVGGISYRDAGQGRIQELLEIPVAVSDYISDTEDCTKDYGPAAGANEFGHDYTQGTPYTASTSTSIFILQFAPDAVCGLQSLPITTEKLGALETKDAERVRIKWYPGLMLQNIVGSSKVTGIDAVTQAVAA